MKRLDEYRPIIGDKKLAEIYKKIRKLYHKRIIHVNSTFMGGGVAEILTSLAPLMNSAGLNADWRTIHGNPDLFNITKKFHNALQGDKINFSQIKKNLYIQASENFAVYANLNYDVVIVHDPQPLPLIDFYKKNQPWIWRCHIDLSNPNTDLWDFLKGYILRYDLAIVSHESYVKKDLPVEQKVIQPVIDPLTPKNMPLNNGIINKYLKKFGVPTDKPIITQISRFDKWKDPVGVIDVFKKVKQKIDCRLVLCGSMASDDPEGIKIYEKVKQRANNLIISGDIILITYENSILVNALQRVSSVIIQKSIREGFGLTVTEALWKEKPVVASRVGGIPLQIEDEKTGFLLAPDDNDGFVDRIVELIKNPALGEQLGKSARENVREKFLITRLLRDYLDIISYELGNYNL